MSLWKGRPVWDLPWLLGHQGVQQLQSPAHQVQAPSNQNVDGSGLPENAGPAVGCGVVEKAPWGALGLEDGIATLADPLQGMGDAAENKGAGARGLRRVWCQQQGAGPRRFRAAAAPEAGAGLFLSQAVPMLLVLEAAEQHLVQSHREVLLVCVPYG